MTIFDRTDRLVALFSLEKGAVLKDYEYGEIWIKTDMEDSETIGIVNLRSGVFMSRDKDCLVAPLDAKLEVWEKHEE